MKLQELFENDKLNVVIITGAGISLRSGIPTYRSVGVTGGQGAIWDEELEALATRAAYLTNPRGWYDHFFHETHMVKSFLTAVPNETHLILTQLVAQNPSRVKVITQNVDNLHRKADTLSENLIEVHGRLGSYRCEGIDCHYNALDILLPKDFGYWTVEEECKHMEDHRTSDRDTQACKFTDALYNRKKQQGSQVKIGQVPCCPDCRSAVMPLVLLFDESYLSHAGFGFCKAIEWMESADVLMFVGTSLNVFFTELAIQIGLEGKKLAISINPVKEIVDFNEYQEVDDSRELESVLSLDAPRIWHLETLAEIAFADCVSTHDYSKIESLRTQLRCPVTPDLWSAHRASLI